jgi:glycosyltransferase involved in cell wall biosynthesis
MASAKPRVLYFLRNYPLVCESYIQTEIEALRPHYEIRVMCRQADPEALGFVDDPAPWVVVPRFDAMLEEIRRFQPQVLHMHWLLDADTLRVLAQRTGLPFTIRAHSFDTIPTPYMETWFKVAPGVLRAAARDEHCRGILAFPFSRPFLEQCGVPADKIHDCHPPVDIKRFMNRAANGAGVINVGACLPKKNLASYIELAARMPDLDFDLYPVGYDTSSIEATNASHGSPVRIHRCVKHAEMPAIYKAHQWLVYTASPELRNVGWPLAVAEAQASGCGVALANVRPDLRDYLGEGGILFDHVDELAGVIDRPVPAQMREAGFVKCRDSDVDAHIHRLTDLWT